MNMYDVTNGAGISWSLCFFMIRSMLAVQPYWLVTTHTGDCINLYFFDTITFSTFVAVLIQDILHYFVEILVSSFWFIRRESTPALRDTRNTKVLPSYSFSCWTASLSLRSTMYNTSKTTFFFHYTKEELKEEFSATSFDSAALIK